MLTQSNKAFNREDTSLNDSSAEQEAPISIFDVLKNYSLIELEDSNEMTKYICIKEIS